MKNRRIIIFIAALICVFGLCSSVYAGEYEHTVDAFKYGSYSIPAYDGDPSETVNSNNPSFSSAELAKEASVNYGGLDSLGRCTPSFARLNISLMPTGERGSISSVYPSGWKQAKYDIIPSGWLYNRCHLIGWQLTGADLTTMDKSELSKNLITGTRYLNVGDGNTGMVGYENSVASFVRKNSGNYVAYRISPVFQGNNLVATGVLMEGQSIGKNDIKFCAFCYNVQPGISINYETGESRLTSSSDEAKEIGLCSVSTKTMVYTGKSLTPKVTVKDGGTVLEEGVSYKMSYKSNVYPGKALATVIGIGDYKGTKSTHFVISPPKGKLLKLQPKKKALKVVTKATPKVSGRQISYRLKNGKWKTIKTTKKTYTIKKLKKKKVYQVKIREYKIIDNKKVYGKWSPVKRMKTR